MTRTNKEQKNVIYEDLAESFKNIKLQGTNQKEKLMFNSSKVS